MSSAWTCFEECGLARCLCSIRAHLHSQGMCYNGPVTVACRHLGQKVRTCEGYRWQPQPYPRWHTENELRGELQSYHQLIITTWKVYTRKESRKRPPHWVQLAVGRGFMEVLGWCRFLSLSCGLKMWIFPGLCELLLDVCFVHKWAVFKFL